MFNKYYISVCHDLSNHKGLPILEILVFCAMKIRNTSWSIRKVSWQWEMRRQWIRRHLLTCSIYLNEHLQYSLLHLLNFFNYFFIFFNVFTSNIVDLRKIVNFTIWYMKWFHNEPAVYVQNNFLKFWQNWFIIKYVVVFYYLVCYRDWMQRHFTTKNTVTLILL